MHCRYGVNRKACLIAVCVFVLTVLPPLNLFAGTLRASLAEMPKYAEKSGSEIQGVLVDLVRAIAEESEQTIDISVVPFKRSIHNVQSGKADFHMPLIKVPDKNESELGFDYSTATIFHVNFVLYTNKNKAVDLGSPDIYKIETDAAHIDYFPFKITPSTRIEGSLKKLNVGRIDAFIFADNASDPIINRLDLKNVKRQLYKVFDVKIVLPPGGHGSAVDNILTSTIQSLRDKGIYQKIMGPIDQPYDDWQP